MLLKEGEDDPLEPVEETGKRCSPVSKPYGQVVSIARLRAGSARGIGYPHPSTVTIAGLARPDDFNRGVSRLFVSTQVLHSISASSCLAGEEIFPLLLYSSMR